MSLSVEIAAERLRQIEVEGWTPEHDDQHTDGSLAQAAECYERHAKATDAERASFPAGCPPFEWPWDAAWWKPSSRKRDAVKAGALAIAESDRIKRLSERRKRPLVSPPRPASRFEETQR